MNRWNVHPLSGRAFLPCIPPKTMRVDLKKDGIKTGDRHRKTDGALYFLYPGEFSLLAAAARLVFYFIFVAILWMKRHIFFTFKWKFFHVFKTLFFVIQYESISIKLSCNKLYCYNIKYDYNKVWIVHIT